MSQEVLGHPFSVKPQSWLTHFYQDHIQPITITTKSTKFYSTCRFFCCKRKISSSWSCFSFKETYQWGKKSSPSTPPGWVLSPEACRLHGLSKFSIEDFRISTFRGNPFERLWDSRYVNIHIYIYIHILFILWGGGEMGVSWIMEYWQNGFCVEICVRIYYTRKYHAPFAYCTNMY